MGDIPFVGVYTLNECTYVVLKQTLNNGTYSGELHIRMESFSGLMTILKGLENYLVKEQSEMKMANDEVPYDPNFFIEEMFKPTDDEAYNPSEPSITYNPSPIDTETPKKTRKRRSDAGIKKTSVKE